MQALLHSTTIDPPAHLEGRSWARTAPAMSPSTAEFRPGMALLVLILVAITFVADLLLPLGVAGGVPYVAPVLMTMWLPARRYLLPMACVCSVLTIAGFFLSAPGVSTWAALTNRSIAVLAIWTVALVALERGRIEEALAESEAKIRAVLATTTDGILTLEGDGRIVSVNPAGARIFGHSETTLVAHPFGRLLGPADRARFERDAGGYLDDISAEQDATHEAVGRRSDGTTFPVELAVVPLALPTGVRYTVTARDLSKQRVLEQHLLRTSEEERRAVGHDLHEELGQTLTGLNLIGRQLARRLETHNAEEAREAADLASLLHEADVLALRLFEVLLPVDAQGGLAEALTRLVEDAASRHGVPCTITHRGALPTVEALHAAQLYRIVQELVYGAIQTGRVSAIELETGTHGRDAHVAIHLRGPGMSDPASWSETLQAVRYRAKVIGKQLDVAFPEAHELRVSCSL